MLNEKLIKDYFNKQYKPSPLEKKLKDLGYEMNMFGYYQKQNINILINTIDNTIFEKDCYVEVVKQIRSRNDIQSLKDNIPNYDEQLRIMWKDLEVLKKCQ